MTPEAALLRAIHCLDRVHEQGFKVKAFLRALETVRNTDPGELEQRADEETLTDLEGIGDSTARLITEALAGGYPSYLEKIEAETPVPITAAGAEYRAALRGDCHRTRAGATAATRSSRWRRPRSTSDTSTWC